MRWVPVGDGEYAGLLAGVHVVDGDVLLAGLLVVDDGVAVAEGAALHVLPAQPHVVACSEGSHLENIIATIGLNFPSTSSLPGHRYLSKSTMAFTRHVRTN